MLRNSFKKQERLTGKRNFEKLLAEGQRVHLFPFTVYWAHFTDQKPPVRIAFSIPKKKFKRAPDRNLLRRRVRESYRTNKHKLNDLLEDRNLQLHILLVYVSGEIVEFETINQKIVEVLNYLTKTFSTD
ncbi:MAG: ribonuclease P protein component [Bacteroidota bacterium]|nr:ribonuclease P protein component [Bacteroidota bacterium]